MAETKQILNLIDVIVADVNNIILIFLLVAYQQIPKIVTIYLLVTEG